MHSAAKSSGEVRMAGQPGLFDWDLRYAALSAAGDPLERLSLVIDFELFRAELDAALDRSDRAKGGRPPYDAVLMFQVLVLQTLYTLSDDQTEYQIRDRLSFMRFLGLALEDRVPDAKTIWLFREQLTQAGAIERLFASFDAVLRRQLGRLLDPDNTASGVWADTAYRSAANVALLARRGLVPQFQRPKPRGRAMPPHIARGNATRAQVRVAIEHVFATQKCRLGLLIRTIGLARATTKLGLANLVTNMRRLVWFELRPQPA
jgi:IS5 family transposase